MQYFADFEFSPSLEDKYYSVSDFFEECGTFGLIQSVKDIESGFETFQSLLQRHFDYLKPGHYMSLLHHTKKSIPSIGTLPKIQSAERGLSRAITIKGELNKMMDIYKAIQSATLAKIQNTVEYLIENKENIEDQYNSLTFISCCLELSCSLEELKIKGEELEIDDLYLHELVEYTDRILKFVSKLSFGESSSLDSNTSFCRNVHSSTLHEKRLASRFKSTKKRYNRVVENTKLANYILRSIYFVGKNKMYLKEKGITSPVKETEWLDNLTPKEMAESAAELDSDLEILFV